MSRTLNETVIEENNYVFKQFNSTDAYNIGTSIVNEVLQTNQTVCVDIFAYGRVLFHFSSNNCIVDNDNWLRRKRNTVLYFNHCSEYMNTKLNGDSTLLESKYGLSINDYAIIPGGFPIKIENCGVVGAICVSGLAPEDDHNLIIKHLEINKSN